MGVFRIVRFSVIGAKPIRASRPDKTDDRASKIP